MGKDRLCGLGRAPILGIQYHTTINDWHTCKASGEIRASNPCSEYMFLDDTACNLASLNLLHSAARTARTRSTSSAFEHCVRLWTMVLEISVLMAQFPSPDRQAFLRVPHARAGLRQYRRPLMTPAFPTIQPRRPGHLRRHHRDHDRRCLRHLGRNGGRARSLPGYAENARAHAARHAQSPARGARASGRL